ncbi:RNA binding protein Rnp24 [Aspergillus steynii IBT 23096]|uniref:RNA binding protein Rnp24 n=1 Tax=Aspergillus steynii IBT 23096 TaxID=1392250 RepID=A0A2I2GFP5_9EURO|nr:RNA binding protein Rnp24 [Aspergillus steynii IBT 23096]PLB51712.1 RNA binding protein Rnp24 [Aspergillus steynii IBT 23096]
MAGIGEGTHKKRKLPEAAEIEIDVSAPEPPSKKALRKAKKNTSETTSEPATEQTTDAPANAQEAPAKRSDYGVWIGNLPFSVNKDDIRRFFTSNCSFAETTITRIHMPKGAEKFGKAQNKGFAYVDFSTERAAKEALGLSEQLVSGRRVLIKDAKSFVGRPEKSQQDGQHAGTNTSSGHPPSRRIFVGNLGFDTTKEAIEEHFAQCGTVAHVHVATFQDTGKCKGYAWVQFEDIAAAEAAVRGFMMVNEDEEDEEDSASEAEERKKPKKPRQRRVWVNQLLGRRMRMEFAEDASTRYKKRFGKEKDAKGNDFGEVSGADNSAGRQQGRPAKPRKPEYSRYDEGTVQKLSGAIVEGQGKKTTFD